MMVAADSFQYEVAAVIKGEGVVTGIDFHRYPSLFLFSS